MSWATTSGGIIFRDLAIVVPAGQLVSRAWPKAAESPNGLAGWPGRSVVQVTARATGYCPGNGEVASWDRRLLLKAEEDNSLTDVANDSVWFHKDSADWDFLAYSGGSELIFEVQGSTLFESHFLLHVQLDLLVVEA